MKPPEALDGAIVIYYSPIDERHRFTGACKQMINGKLMGATAGLAICQYPGDGSYYLFGCDVDWKVVTDTYHQTIAEAKEQAEYEYMGITQTWTQAKSR